MSRAINLSIHEDYRKYIELHIFDIHDKVFDPARTTNEYVTLSRLMLQYLTLYSGMDNNKKLEELLNKLEKLENNGIKTY